MLGIKSFDYTVVDAERIPDHVFKEEELVQKRPAFFRTLSGSRSSHEELENMVKLLRDR